jgi:1-acyl-sn-glycerol-3-phosphate acyltransferase
MRLWWRWLLFIFRAIGLALFQVRLYGIENVPRKGGVILACNHQSFFDPVLVGMGLPREIHFMARRSLFNNPVFGALIVVLNAFPISRDSRDVKGVKESIARLQSGCALLIFPEGTRTRDGNVAPVKAGIGMIAKRAAVPIVPVLIEGAYKVWPRNRILPGPGRVNVSFGPALCWSDTKECGDRLSEDWRGLYQRVHRKVQRSI